MELYEELEKRGFIAQTIFTDELKEKLNHEKITFYIGFDPTADSLHIGHLIQIILARKLQKAGHRPIFLIGGATGAIGDPSGRQDLRKVMDQETIDHNVENITKQLKKYISLDGENGAIILNNAMWNRKIDYISYLKDVGLLFTVNNMLRAECYKSRLEMGLTFFEMGYMLIQAYDFYYLRKNYNCILQIGGNDQWSNILAGAELIKKKLDEKSYLLSTQLLLTSDGRKMGKSQKGVIWIDKEKTSPYEIYQILRNIDDASVNPWLKRLTDIDIEKIDEMTKDGSNINYAKKVLAYEFVKLVHGEEEANKAKEQSEALFSSKKLDYDNLENVESYKVKECDSLLEICKMLNIASSNGQIKMLFKQNAITLNDEIISDPFRKIVKEDFKGNSKNKYAILKKGKKNIFKLELES